MTIRPLWLLLFLAVVLLVGFGLYIYATGISTTLLPDRSANVPSVNINVVENVSQQPRPMKTQIYAKNLVIPWAIVFTSVHRMLVTERTGAVRVIESGRTITQPLHTFSEASQTDEAGLMGMARDPYYEKNSYMYFCLAYQKGSGLVNKVVRMTDMGDKLAELAVVIDDIPAAKFHAGCRIRFGTDDKLYITTGDALEMRAAQSMESYAGKILRINADGSLPEDNPFLESAIYSLGHRNPQGIDWHPITGELYATEHGPSGFDGPGGGDELNLIRAGNNYGWPEVSHSRSREGMMDPLMVMTPAEAPASGVFYRGDMFPEWKNTYFFGALKGEGLMKVTLNDDGTVKNAEKLFNKVYGRIREVAEGPDGSLYFTTSNRDGRGTVRADDDVIVRLYRED